jgi:hypothetical protein
LEPDFNLILQVPRNPDFLNQVIYIFEQMSTHMLTLPANESICEIKEHDNVTDFLHQHVDVTTPLQVTSSREPDSIIASLMLAYKNLNSLHGTEKESYGQNMPEYPPYHQSTTNSPKSGLDELCLSGAVFSSPLTTISGKDRNCLRNDSENLLHNSISFSNNPCVSKILENSLARHPVLAHEQLLVPDPQEFLSLFTPEESFIVQNELMQMKDATQITFQGSSGLPELPNRTPEDATTARSDDGMNMKECDADNGLLESMILDLSTNSFVQDWSGDSVLQAGSLSNLGDIHSESVSELANKHSLSTGDSSFPAISVIEQLLGGRAHKPAGHIPPVTRTSSALAGSVSEHFPQLAFREGLTAYTTQVPSLACGSYKSSAQNGASKANSVPPADISVDDSCNTNTAKSKDSQSNNPEGMKVAKKRARAGESTRPRPKDRQLIQDRVKELREMVPNGAKVATNHPLGFQVYHVFLE